MDSLKTVISKKPLRIGSVYVLNGVYYTVDYYCGYDIYIISPREVV